MKALELPRLDLKMSEVFEAQEEVRWVNHWPKYTPDDAQAHLLGATEEIGEISEIIRKCGHEAIMNSPTIRRKLTTEVVDAVSYLVNVLLSYGITAEEFSEAFVRKPTAMLAATIPPNTLRYARK